MAKKLTTEQAMDARESLGVSTDAVEMEFRAPRNPTLKSAAEIQGEKLAADVEPTHSLWDETKAAFTQDNSFVRGLVRTEPEFLIDTNYDPKQFLADNKPRIDALQGVDIEELAADIGSSSSAEEADFRLGQIEKDYENEQLLIEGGGSALLLRMGAAVLDPVDWAIAAGTGGTVGAIAKAGKMGRILTSAAAAGAASAGTEAILASNNAFRDETDVAFAALAGITLGGGLASLSKAENDDLMRAANDLANGEIDAAATRLGIPEDSAGAARRRLQRLEDDTPLSRSTEEILDDMEAPEFRFKGWNWLLNNLQSKLFWSKSDSMRKVSSALFEGGFLKNKDKVRELTAEGRANQLQDVFERGVYAETLSDFKAWAKRKGHGSARRNFTTSTGEEFYSQVGLAMRGVTVGVGPEAARAAQKIRGYMDNVHALAQRAGVKGFDKAGLEDYFPRMLNKSKFQEMHSKYGSSVLTQFYTDAILKGANEGMTSELAEKIAKAYVRTMRMKAAGIETDLLHGIRLDDVDKLREMFDGYDGIDEIISEIEYIKAKEMADRGTVSFGKKRIQFDETHADLLDDGMGGSARLRFTDLYENDARMVLARYGRAMHGHIAIAEKLGVRSRMEFEEFKKQIASEIEEAGGDVKKEIQALEDGYNLLLGQPIERFNPTGDGAKLSRTVSGYNYMTRGGQFGVNALAEAGNIVGQGGLRSVFRMFTDLPKVLKRAQDGDLEHSVARFAELAFAPGIQTLTKHAVRNLDELAEDFAGTSVISKLTAKLDPFIKSGGRFTSIASGLGPITDATQRLSAITWIEKLGRFAKNGRISDSQVRRLRANGINADMQERIFEMFRQAGTWRKGRLTDIDPDRWVDQEALEVFSQAASREVRNAIQMTDISTSTLLFHHPVGRLMFQFMRFPMDAVNKQLLRQMHHMDSETATAYAASLGIASLVYMAQTNIEFANDPEERAKRLEPKNLAKVTFMRTGFSSMLPGLWDTGIQAAGFDPWFAMGRSSGLGTLIPTTGNPTMTALSNFNKGVLGGVRAAAHDDIQYSQSDFRSLAQLAPGYRLLGIKNVVHALEEQFPESRKQE